MMIVVITPDGAMLGLFTSQVDAWKVAKPIGASMWSCTPNSGVCEKIEWMLPAASTALFDRLRLRRPSLGTLPYNL
eukprot:COSAG02_NODE_6787_length_3361_cov_5.477928_4_plen_76_part_00